MIVSPQQVPWHLFYDRVGDDCTCHAPEMALHNDDCGVSPIYASVVADVGLPPRNWPLV